MFSNAQKGAWPERFSLACVDADNIILETVKRAEDSDALILRLYETWNRATDCSIRFGRLMEMAAQCDMMEENEALLQVEGNRLRLHFRPFEIKTFKGAAGAGVRRPARSENKVKIRGLSQDGPRIFCQIGLNHV